MSSAETEAVKGKNMKRLSDLKVVELKEELKKRNAETVGFRLALIERLGNILKDEGHEVDTYLFDMNARRSSESAATAKEHVSTTEDSTAENSRESGDLVMDEGVVQVDEDGDSLMEEDAIEVEEDNDEEAQKEDIELEETEEVMLEAVEIEKDEEVPESEEVDDDMNQGNEDSEEAEETEVARNNDADESEVQKPLKHEVDKQCSMWVRGISNSTKAADIKALFTTVGKVQTAKIFNTKSTPAACFGFVTMYSPEDVDLCIEKLHRTNFKGKVISVEKAEKNAPVIKKSGPSTPPLPSTPSSDPLKSGNADMIGSPVSGDDVQVVESKPTSKSTKTPTSPSVSKKASVPESAKTNGNNISVKKPSASSTNKKPITSTASKPKVPVTALKSSSTNKTHSNSSRLQKVSNHHFRHSTGSARAPPYESSRYREAVVRSRRPIPPPSSRPPYDPRRHHSRSPPHMMVRHEMMDRREIADLLRRKEEEHRRREEELRLQRERERIRYEREKLEREKLEVQQMRHQAMASSAPAVPPVIGGGSSSTARRGTDFHSSSSSNRPRRDFADGGSGAAVAAARRRSRSPHARRDSRVTSDRDRTDRRGHGNHASSASTAIHSDRDRFRSEHTSSRRGPGRDDTSRDPRDTSRSATGIYRSVDSYPRPVGVSNSSSSYGHGSTSFGSQVAPAAYGGYGSSASRPAEYGLSSYESSRGSYGRSEVLSGGVGDYGNRRDDGGYVAPRGSAWGTSSSGNYARSRDSYNDHSSSWTGGSMSSGQRWP